MKKRRFLVPVAVALAFHAVLLFGFRGGPERVADAGRSTPVTPKPTPPEVVEMEFPRAEEDSPPPAERKGNPDVSRPELPDPAVNLTSLDIAMPLTTPRPVPPDHHIIALSDPWGNPHGVEWAEVARNGPVASGHLDNPPRTRTQIAPVYPYEARVDGRPGEVLVEFVVDETGRVIDPQVVRSSDPLFEAPTLRAVAKWRFEPGKKNGRVVRFRMAVPVGFALNP